MKPVAPGASYAFSLNRFLAYRSRSRACASRLGNYELMDPKLRPATGMSARFDKKERLIAYAAFFNATLPFLLRSARTNLSHLGIPARFSGM
jgi:hypothetical protein